LVVGCVMTEGGDSW